MNNNLFDLTGKVVVMTGAGANGGIGHAIALGLARYGADMAVSDIDDEGVRVTGEEIRALGRRTLVSHCDIGDPAQIEALFAEVDREFGRVDILVNVPFVFPVRVRPADMTLEHWELSLRVNLTGYFLCCQQALRRMVPQGGGAVLSISSGVAVLPAGRGMFAYGIAKAGVAHMTKELAVEYAGQGIRFNAILPAQTATPRFKRNAAGDPNQAETLKHYLKAIPMNRMMETEDYVGPAVFLCSAASGGVTGVLLPVDGGNLVLNAGGYHTWPED